MAIDFATNLYLGNFMDEILNQEINEETEDTLQQENFEVIDNNSCDETTEVIASDEVCETIEEVSDEVVEEVTETTEEISEEVTCEESEITQETCDEVETAIQEEEKISEEVSEEVIETTEEVSEEVDGNDDEDGDDDDDKEEEEIKKEKTAFKLTLPANAEELQEKMCAKRGRKLIYKPNEVIFEGSYKVLGTDKTNDEGIKCKDILDAEISEGLKQGYLDKFDGLKTSEIKEEYENDVVYELAEQEFRKMGVIYDGEKIKVYVYDWDRKGMHHIGYIDETEGADAIKYFSDKESYSFDICGIITGGKAKRVTKDEKGKIKITKEKGDPIGVELDVTVVKRKD